MGILNKLANNGSTLSEFDGATPPQMDGSKDQSKLHNHYSINGNPNVVGKPSPSGLDLNGLTPSKYTDNLPG
tara:strand:- start:331 stop:546 length:216 start_codon:yes stop_codon:yes gene_type:complete